MVLPENWAQISVNKYKKMILSGDFFKEVATLANIDEFSDEIMNLTPNEAKNIKESLNFLNFMPENCPERIEVDGITYFKRNFHEMNVFEWRTLDFYTKKGSNDYISHIIASSYLQIGEKWGFDLQKRAKTMENAPMSALATLEWVSFRDLCFEKFPLSEENGERTEVLQENYQQRAERLENERKMAVNNELFWEKTLLSLCNDSILDSYNAQHLPVLHIFRMITVFKEKNAKK